jgi:hypothetical protein
MARINTDFSGSSIRARSAKSAVQLSFFLKKMSITDDDCVKKMIRRIEFDADAGKVSA